MSIIEYYSPFRELENIRANIDRFFSTGFNAMPIDIQETEEEYIITAELPGFTDDQIDIQATQDELIIRAEEVEEENEDKDDDEIKYIYRERRNRRFVRRLGFNKPINPNKAKVSLENGILTIKMPKADEAKFVKLIPEKH